MVPHLWDGNRWTCIHCRQEWPDPCACPCHSALCLRCGYSEHLTVRRWYMGHRECWWCDYCLDITPVLVASDSALGVDAGS